MFNFTFLEEGEGGVCGEAAIKFAKRKNTRKFENKIEWKYLKVAYIKSRESLKNKIVANSKCRESREKFLATISSRDFFFPRLFLPLR